MTYPPQGPYGQQPDPYGQQQPQYGGYDPNIQYGGGYQQYGGLGGPPPPPKSKTGPVVAVVAVVVLLLGGLGITGFVAPGFFLSDEDSGGNAGSGDTSGEQTEDKGPDAETFMKELVAAADEQDKSALRTMACTGATATVGKAIDAIDEIDGAELGAVEDESADEIRFIVTITYEGEDEDDTITIKKDGDEWCWHDLSAGSVDSGGGSSDDTTAVDDTPEVSTIPSAPDERGEGNPDGEELVRSFVEKFNSGDGAGAAAMACSDSTSQTDITEAATQGARIEVDPAGVTADNIHVAALLEGSIEGAPGTGEVTAFTEDDGTWCIYTFYFYPA